MQPVSIHVNRLNALYQLPRSRAGASVSVQKRLDRIASDHLVRTLENEFDPAGFISGGFYFIEKLNLDFALDINEGDDSLAKAWAVALNESIYKMVLADSSVISFRNRAAFLVGLVEHLLRGSSWDWYYDEFAGLRSLSLGQAITKLLSEDPDDGREILLELARRGELDLVLASLADSEVDHIVSKCLLPESPTFVPAGAYARWAGALREVLNETFRFESRIAHDVARIYLSLLRTRPDLGPDVNLARFVRDLLQLRQSIRSLPDVSQLLFLIESEDVPACVGLLGSSQAASLLPKLIRNCGGAETAALFAELDASSGTLEQFVTEFGGIFFLVPAILDLGAADLLDTHCAYPDPEFGPRKSWLLLLTALQCLGPNSSRAWKDKALTTFAGFSGVPSLQLVERYAATLTPSMHRDFAQAIDSLMPLAESETSSWFSICRDHEATGPLIDFQRVLARFSAAVLRRFAARLGAFSDASPAYLYQNILASRAAVKVSSERIEVRLLTCPLQMVLRMAGFDHNKWRIPWLDHRTLEFLFD
jgi:hypothetical protein